MPALPVWLLLLALTVQQTAAAPLMSPVLDGQDRPQLDGSTVKFHLVANTDVSKRVSSKGLVFAPWPACTSPARCHDCTASGNQLFFLSVASFPAARMVLTKKCGHLKLRMDSTFWMAASLPASERPRAQRQAR
jgi:hypothetical protein